MIDFILWCVFILFILLAMGAVCYVVIEQAKNKLRQEKLDQYFIIDNKRNELFRDRDNFQR